MAARIFSRIFFNRAIPVLTVVDCPMLVKADLQQKVMQIILFPKKHIINYLQRQNVIKRYFICIINGVTTF